MERAILKDLASPLPVLRLSQGQTPIGARSSVCLSQDTRLPTDRDHSIPNSSDALSLSDICRILHRTRARFCRNRGGAFGFEISKARSACLDFCLPPEPHSPPPVSLRTCCAG